MNGMKRRIRTGAAALAVVLTALALSVSTFAAAEYEPLEVVLPYKHIYTTNDKAVDALFHYIIESKTEDGALPAEADANGVFTFQGNDGAGVTSGANTVYDLQGELHFTFTKPGTYEYLIRGDLVTDGQKAHADRYTFEHRQYTVYFYIANDTDNGPKLTMRMLTAQDDSGIKENFVELDPVYKGPTSTPPETGDTTPIGLYESLMLGSAVLILLFAGQALRKKAKNE